VELLPLPALPLPAGSRQRRHHGSHGALKLAAPLAF
jgi:hypothetical protein